MSSLQVIQQMQFQDRGAAEALLLAFMRNDLNLHAAKVELRPLAVSLNSFNGFVTLDDGQRLFFKTHTEPDNILAEYYNAEQLEKAGYPIVKPLFSSTESGKQLLIYEVIEDPSVFDVAWSIENGENQHEAGLTNAQQRADDDLFDLYISSLGVQSAEDDALTPIHQLFSHRITAGRLDRFYRDPQKQTFTLPSGDSLSVDDLWSARWVINGQHYSQSIGDLVQTAQDVLHPGQAGISVIGHGDAHNGNVFFDAAQEKLTYFDPAFAGRHHPLLDLTKPLYHNVFAMWMYFPREKNAQTQLNVRVEQGTLHVEHDYAIAPIRHMFLRSKADRVLMPILSHLHRAGQLRPDWRIFLKSSLMCCPLLTMNLLDEGRFPPAITMLGFCHAVEMGGDSQVERSLIDALLDEMAQNLG
ncbi:MAG: phosphotransferase [Pleurocapsa minor GSE-CHR-MK-17-07R]|jgi:hypothetical protein|nr:phosphotransferase [Pleurocapsa minor GSE-CHR-MK 17-07R]